MWVVAAAAGVFGWAGDLDVGVALGARGGGGGVVCGVTTHAVLVLGSGPGARACLLGSVALGALGAASGGGFVGAMAGPAVRVLAGLGPRNVGVTLRAGGRTDAG
jgi:hypothetical protein